MTARSPSGERTTVQSEGAQARSLLSCSSDAQTHLPPPPIYSLQTCRGTERMACTAYAAQMRVGSNLSVMVLRAGQELTLTLR